MDKKSFVKIFMRRVRKVQYPKDSDRICPKYPFEIVTETMWIGGRQELSKAGSGIIEFVSCHHYL